MNWTIQCNGTEKLLADWGLCQVKRKLVSNGADELTFKADGTLADAPLLFRPFVDTVILWRNRAKNTDGSFSGGQTWFSGLIIQAPRTGSPDAESMQYKATGPWWYLDNRVFHQVYQNIFLGFSVAGDPSSQPLYASSTSTHLFLNQGLSGTALARITTGQQIVDALTWAIKPFTDASQPPPFQIGTINLPVFVPIDEVRDITCAEVIRKMLRWSPDAVTWFDYTTTPPTFHCAKRADLTITNIDISQGNFVRDIAVNARYDLQAPGVQIYYEESNSVNGSQSLSIFTDFYPNPLPTAPMDQYSLLEFTVDLQGLQASLSTAKITCDPITPTDPLWWQGKHPQYKPWDQTNPADSQNEIASFTIDATTLQRTPNPPKDTYNNPIADLGLTNELTTGELTSWMTFKSQRISLSVQATVVTRKGEIKKFPINYQCLSTNATTGTYNSQTISLYAETPPTGLAQFIYEAISVLQFQGKITLQEEDVSGTVMLGQLFNLTGGALAEWTTMNAMIESVTEDIDNGATVIEFGPSRSLNAGELVNLLRVNRARLIESAYSMRISGTTSNP